MSTVPEVVAAKEEGMNVIVLSLVTNAVVIPEKYRSIKEEVEAEVSFSFSLSGYLQDFAANYGVSSLLVTPSKRRRLRLFRMTKS
jgi:hypothetical protein